MNFGKSFWRPSWPLLVWLCSFLAVFLIWGGNGLLNDPDSYWHVETGRWIISHGSIPAQDPFSHSLAQAPWTSHEWLAEVVFAWVYGLAGWTGVVAMTVAVFAGTLALIVRFLLRYLEPIYALLFLAISYGLMTSHLLARPHVLGLALLAIWCRELIGAAERGAGPNYWLLPLMTLWANLHGGFTFGLFLIPFFAVESVLVHDARADRFRIASAWALFFLLAFVAALLTPHGFGSFIFTLKILSMNYAHSQILEWQSTDFQRFYVIEILLGLLLALSFGKGMTLPPVRLILLLVLLHLALRYSRNMELLGVVAPMLLAAPFARQWRVGGGREVDGLDRFFRNLARPAGIGAVSIGLSAAVFVTCLAWSRAPFHPAGNITPAAAVQAARQAGVSGPVFNSFGFGGYLIFVGIPTFIDGRFDMYGDRFFSRYQQAEDLLVPGELENVFKDYGIEWTLLTPHSAAVSVLDRLDGWRRVYADDVAVVHMRNRP